MSEINPGLAVLLNRDILQHITCFHTNSARKFITCGRAHLLPGHLARLLPHLSQNLSQDAEYIVNSGDSRYLEFIIKYDLLAPMMTALNLAYTQKKLGVKTKQRMSIFRMIWEPSNVLSKAAYSGHKQIVEFIIQNCPDKKPGQAFSLAARAGQLEILKILHAQWPFCPKQEFSINDEEYAEVGDIYKCFFSDYDNAATAIRYAAEFGYLDVVKWLIENRPSPDLKFGESLCAAASNGHLHILKYLELLDSDINIVFSPYSSIISNGHFETLKWMYARYPEDLNRLLPLAAKTGNLEMLQWLNRIFPDNINHEVLELATKSGNIEMFEWVIGLYCPDKNTNIINYAASSGNLDFVKHIISLGFKVDYGAMDKAAQKGHLSIVKWLHDSGYDCSRNAMNWAAKLGHLNVVKWLYENRTEGCYYYAATDAAENDHFDIVKFIVDKYPMVCHAAEILVISCKNGHNNIAKWIFENNLAQKDSTRTYDISMQFIETAIFIAKGADNNEMADWLEAEKHKLGEPIETNVVMPESEQVPELPEIDYHEHLMAEMYTAD